MHDNAGAVCAVLYEQTDTRTSNFTTLQLLPALSGYIRTKKSQQNLVTSGAGTRGPGSIGFVRLFGTTGPVFFQQQPHPEP